MVNTQALLDIIPVLRQLDAEQRFNMRNWASGEVNPNAADITECGTQFCLAGAKLAVDGEWRPQYVKRGYFNAQGEQEWHTVATGLFVPETDRHNTDEEAGQLPRDIAAEAFGLSYLQAEFLFMGMHITRLDDLVARIQYVIDHPDDATPHLHYSTDHEHRHADADADREHRWVLEQRAHLRHLGLKRSYSEDQD